MFHKVMWENCSLEVKSIDNLFRTLHSEFYQGPAGFTENMTKHFGLLFIETHY